jgi:hypothetical protein
VVLLATVGGLTAGLVGANGRANTAAAELKAERSSALASAPAAQESLSAAQEAQQSAESRASTAEGAASSAESAAQAAQAPSSGAADDNYLALLRSNDPAFASVPDASLINIGQITYQYFAQFGNGDAAIVHVVDNATSNGLTAQQAAAVISSAIESYCPQYKVGG